jgi:cation diffusion facilitator CzcD-associated flavoprotein CzcO
VEYVDVVIVGAGLSGIGAARHLQERCPGRSYLIVEARDAIGGTWDLFRYPGIRSDSDMFTLGYGFKPWRGRKAVADGASIKRYIEETADEAGIREKIRFGHRLVAADWSSEAAQWVLQLERTHGGERVQLACNFLLPCSGYYSYERGYTPELPGRERFGGQIVHPQDWPEDLDYAGKRVIVIGSGATAVTLIPNLAKQAAHVTMLQRSPTYVVSRPQEDRLANLLRKWAGDETAYRFTRWKNSTLQSFMYRHARKNPDAARKRLLEMLSKELPEDVIREHFTPSYNPWEQRLCLVPDSDLFAAIREGKASVVTDHIETFTEKGILLKSGRELEADLIVTATGLELIVLGGAKFSIDGERVDFAETWSYRGMMASGVPNMLWTFGYINASWTLRADLVAEFACRILNHMAEVGARVCVPKLRPGEQDMPRRSWLEGFNPGYIERVQHLFPKQGDREPWLNSQNYRRDKRTFREVPIDDGVLSFS